MAGGQRGVGVAAERHRHLELAVGDVDVGAHRDIGLLAGGGLELLGALHHRSDILLALRIRRVLVIQHHALRHRATWPDDDGRRVSSSHASDTEYKPSYSRPENVNRHDHR